VTVARKPYTLPSPTIERTSFTSSQPNWCISTKEYASKDLNIKGLAKTKLAKSVLDAALGMFRTQLHYKTLWNRRHLGVIDRWFPSSKACRICGCVNAELMLADRVWLCCCGAIHDRDFNASLNIRSEGLKLMPVAAGHVEI
jgi:putative transposase